MKHDPLCPHSADPEGCRCLKWIRRGDEDFDPDKDCELCNCFCKIIETVRADERERWIDFSHILWGTHTEECPWWGRDRAYSQYCEDRWAASWIQCPCNDTVDNSDTTDNKVQP